MPHKSNHSEKVGKSAGALPPGASKTGYTAQPHRVEMLQFIPQDAGTLLDVGCGTGNFGVTLKQDRTIETWGVEPFVAAADEARTKFDHVVNAPFSPESDIPNDYFDVVTFNDSLEHFPEPFAPLELAKAKLKPNGVVVASIPNMRYIETMKHLVLDLDWEYEESGIRDKTHLRFFTKKSMKATFEAAGYDVESVDGISPHYWSGKKIFLLNLFFRKWVEDMKYFQYVVTASPTRLG